MDGVFFFLFCFPLSSLCILHFGRSSCFSHSTFSLMKFPTRQFPRRIGRLAAMQNWVSSSIFNIDPSLSNIYVLSRTKNRLTIMTLGMGWYPDEFKYLTFSSIPCLLSSAPDYKSICYTVWCAGTFCFTFNYHKFTCLCSKHKKSCIVRNVEFRLG